MNKMMIDYGRLETNIYIIDEGKGTVFSKHFFTYSSSFVTDVDLIEWIEEKAFIYKVNEIIFVNNGAGQHICEKLVSNGIAAEIKVYHGAPIKKVFP